MRAAIFNPYLDTLGGGERYSMGVARALVSKGYNVDLQWKDKKIVEKLELRFGQKLNGINVVKDINRGDGYEVCFWVSDGSIPLLKARNNMLHFQVPFKSVNGNSIINRMKFFRINSIICNSGFTKAVIDREYGVKSTVLYPPVDTKAFKPGKKENLILYVGRFSQLKQNKGQEILVDSFKKLFDSGNKDWKLILAGGVEVGVGDLVDKLKKESEDYPIKIATSPKFKTIKDYYSKAKIFWSAAGYGIDERKEPEKVEHFGITVVEAMAAGVVPVVYLAGGPKEIIEEDSSGLFWTNKTDLLDKTKSLANNAKKLRKMSKLAIENSEKYSLKNFSKEFYKYI